MNNRAARLRTLLGIVISLAALSVLVWLVDGQEVMDALRGINPVVVIPVLILLLASLLTRAAAWREILEGRISLDRSFFIINTGYFVNTILPFRIGEITRAFLLLPAGLVFWEALPSILLERMFDFAFALALFFSGLPFAAGFDQGGTYAGIISFLLVAGGLVLILLIRYQRGLLAWIDRTELFSEKGRGQIRELALPIFRSLSVLKNPSRLGKVALWMMLSWLIALLNQYLLLRAFVPEASWVWAAFGLGALALGVSIPSSPGNIGVYEASLVIALSAFGVDQSLAFAYALTSHILSLLVTTLLGAYGLVREGFNLGDVWKLRSEKIKES